MEQKSTGYYVLKAAAGLAAIVLGGAAKNKIKPEYAKEFNNTMKQAGQNVADGVKGVYNNQKNNQYML